MIVFINLFYSCNDDIKIDESIPDSRSFYMGFTGFPYDLSLESVDTVFREVVILGDIYLNHFDKGIPWDESLKDELPEFVKNDLVRKSDIPGHKLFQTIAITSTTREDLANYWSADGEDLPLPDKWNSKSFDDPEVIKAYLNFCRNVIEYAKPDYFAFAIEINASFKRNTTKWHSYLNFADTVYHTLKKEFPDIPILQTMQDQSFNKSKKELLDLSRELLPYTDMIAVSTYPYWQYKYPKRNAEVKNISQDWLYEMRDLDPDKPFAISETGYIAEDLIMDTIGVYIKGTEESQKDYTQLMFNRLNEMGAKFVCWFVYRDYDMLYEKFSNPPFIFKVWKDTGIKDGDGKRRKSYYNWEKWKELPVK